MSSLCSTLIHSPIMLIFTFWMSDGLGGGGVLKRILIRLNASITPTKITFVNGIVKKKWAGNRLYARWKPSYHFEDLSLLCKTTSVWNIFMQYRLTSVCECICMHVFMNLHMPACTHALLCTVTLTNLTLLWTATLFHPLYFCIPLCVSHWLYLRVSERPLSPHKKPSLLYFMDQCHVFVLC